MSTNNRIADPHTDARLDRIEQAMGLAPIPDASTDAPTIPTYREPVVHTAVRVHARVIPTEQTTEEFMQWLQDLVKGDVAVGTTASIRRNIDRTFDLARARLAPPRNAPPQQPNVADVVRRLWEAVSTRVASSMDGGAVDPQSVKHAIQTAFEEAGGVSFETSNPVQKLGNFRDQL